jgi:hypothetical protein
VSEGATYLIKSLASENGKCTMDFATMEACITNSKVQNFTTPTWLDNGRLGNVADLQIVI